MVSRDRRLLASRISKWKTLITYRDGYYTSVWSTCRNNGVDESCVRFSFVFTYGVMDSTRSSGLQIPYMTRSGIVTSRFPNRSDVLSMVTMLLRDKLNYNRIHDAIQSHLVDTPVKTHAIDDKNLPGGSL